MMRPTITVMSPGFPPVTKRDRDKGEALRKGEAVRSFSPSFSQTTAVLSAESHAHKMQSL